MGSPALSVVSPNGPLEVREGYAVASLGPGKYPKHREPLTKALRDCAAMRRADVWTPSFDRALERLHRCLSGPKDATAPTGDQRSWTWERPF